MSSIAMKSLPTAGERANLAKVVMGALLSSGAWRAVLYLSPTDVVRATRRWYRRGRKSDDRRPEVLVSFTRPNYKERDFVKACRKASEPFPVKKIQLQFRKAR